MCTETKIELTNKEKDKILQACESVIGLEIRYDNLKEDIRDEKIDREKDIKELKDNYLKRFDKLENISNKINDKIMGLFWTIIGICFSGFAFSILNGIFKWII